MKRDKIWRQLVPCLLSILLFIPCVYAYDTMSNPEWHIDIWDSGYSDWMICPQGHEQLWGEWGAAIMYDGIATGEAMWLEKYWVCPDWTSNSQFSVIQPFTSWDDPANPIEGYKDTGQSMISNGDVEITINCSMVDGYTVMGLSPGVETPNRVTSYRYVMLQTYTIRNVKNEDITNLSFFQMMHAHPNDNYDPNNYGVYDPTDYSDPGDDFAEFHYDMTFFAPYANWVWYMDDVVGFSASVQPTAYEIGTFPSDYCGGGEPGPGSLHHEVEADNLKGVNYLGPEEIAGAMKWYLGTLKAGEEVSLTVLLSTSHSDMGLPPEPVPEPTVINYTGDTQGCQGGQVTLSARLTDQNGNPISGKVINFLVGNQSAEAVTDESGIAITSLLLNQAPGNYMVTASFIGDNEYGGSLDSHPFEVCSCVEGAGITAKLKCKSLSACITPPPGYVLEDIVGAKIVSVGGVECVVEGEVVTDRHRCRTTDCVTVNFDASAVAACLGVSYHRCMGETLVGKEICVEADLSDAGITCPVCTVLEKCCR